MRPRSAALLAVAAVGVALLSGCRSGGSPAATPTSQPAGGSGTARPSPSASAAALPETCQELLPLLDLDQALGAPIVGTTVYIKGQPEPKINRTGRVTCRLGVHRLPGNKTSPPKLELGVSSYTDADSAAQRVRSTVTALREQGSSPTEVQVGGMPGTVLIGSGPATLVVATGTRTLVISLYPGVVRGANTAKALVAAGELAMKNLPQ